MPDSVNDAPSWKYLIRTLNEYGSPAAAPGGAWTAIFLISPGSKIDDKAVVLLTFAAVDRAIPEIVIFEMTMFWMVISPVPAEDMPVSRMANGFVPFQ